MTLRGKFRNVMTLAFLYFELMTRKRVDAKGFHITSQNLPFSIIALWRSVQMEVVRVGRLSCAVCLDAGAAELTVL